MVLIHVTDKSISCDCVISTQGTGLVALRINLKIVYSTPCAFKCLMDYQKLMNKVIKTSIESIKDKSFAKGRDKSNEK